MEKLLREGVSVGIVYGDEVPGEQFVDAVYRVLGDAGQDLAEIAFEKALDAGRFDIGFFAEVADFAEISRFYL